MKTVPDRVKRNLTVIAIVLFIVLGLLTVATVAQGETKCQDSPTVCWIKKYWPGDDAWAYRTTYCESRHDRNAQRPGSQYIGVWQIGSRTHSARIAELGYTTDDLRDPGKATVVAWDLFQDAGRGAWACG